MSTQRELSAAETDLGILPDPKDDIFDGAPSSATPASTSEVDKFAALLHSFGEPGPAEEQEISSPQKSPPTQASGSTSTPHKAGKSCGSGSSSPGPQAQSKDPDPKHIKPQINLPKEPFAASDDDEQVATGAKARSQNKKTAKGDDRWQKLHEQIHSTLHSSGTHKLTLAEASYYCTLTNDERKIMACLKACAMVQDDYRVSGYRMAEELKKAKSILQAQIESTERATRQQQRAASENERLKRAAHKVDHAHSKFVKDTLSFQERSRSSVVIEREATNAKCKAYDTTIASMDAALRDERDKIVAIEEELAGNDAAIAIMTRDTVQQADLITKMATEKELACQERTKLLEQMSRLAVLLTKAKVCAARRGTDGRTAMPNHLSQPRSVTQTTSRDASSAPSPRVATPSRQEKRRSTERPRHEARRPSTSSSAPAASVTTNGSRGGQPSIAPSTRVIVNKHGSKPATRVIVNEHGLKHATALKENYNRVEISKHEIIHAKFHLMRTALKACSLRNRNNSANKHTYPGYLWGLPYPGYLWGLPITERQRLYHATHGNGSRVSDKNCNSPGCYLTLHHAYGHSFEIMTNMRGRPRTRTRHSPITKAYILTRLNTPKSLNLVPGPRDGSYAATASEGMRPHQAKPEWDTTQTAIIDAYVNLGNTVAIPRNAVGYPREPPSTLEQMRRGIAKLDDLRDSKKIALWEQHIYKAERHAELLRQEWFSSPLPAEIYDAVEAMLQLPCSYLWALPMTERQREYHALHGNGTRLISKISTEGIPILAKDAASAEQFIEYELNLRAWCAVSGCLAYVIGPAPATPPATPPEKLTEHLEKLALGMRYVCASIGHQDLTAAIATHGNNSGPKAFAYLRSEFLQGTELQPALNIIIDGLRLKPSENIVPWKQRFMKFAENLDPQPHANILCAKFIKAVTAETNGIYEECITSANAVDREQSNFRTYATLVSQLASQKLQRINAHVREHVALNAQGEAESKGTGDPLSVQALLNRIQELEAHIGDTGRFNSGGGKGSQRAPAKGGDSSRMAPDRPCVKCGQKGHLTRDCSVEVSCDFTFPNGEQCARPHLARFCWFKDPARCRDPKVRALIEKKIAAKSTTSGTSSHYLQLEDDGEFHCATIEDDGGNDPPITLCQGRHTLEYFCICAECPHGSVYICTECPLTQCTVCDPSLMEELLSTPEDEVLPILEEWEEWINWPHFHDVDVDSGRNLGTVPDGAGAGVANLEGTKGLVDLSGLSTCAPADGAEAAILTREDVQAHTTLIVPGEPCTDCTTQSLITYHPKVADDEANLTTMEHDIVDYYFAPLLDDSTATNLFATSKKALAMMKRNVTERIVLYEGAEIAAVEHGYQSAEHMKSWKRAMQEWYREVGGETHPYKEYLTAYMTDFDMTPFRKPPMRSNGPVHLPVQDLTIGCMNISLPPTELSEFLYVDTGASDHIIRDSLALIEPKKHQVINIRIKTGNAVSRATRRGPASITVKDSLGNPYMLTRNVIYCPGFAVNLYSPNKDWKEHGTRVEFEDRMKLTLSDGTIIPFEECNSSYRMYYETLPVQAHLGKALALPRGLNPANIWHRRMGHQSFEMVRTLPKHSAGVSLDITSAAALEHQQRCTVCPLSRMKATPHPQNRHRGILTKAYGDRIHMDLAGPLSPPDYESGGRYVTVFVDEHTGHIGIYVIHQKDDHHIMHKQYCADMAGHGGMEIREFHSDNGGEFISNDYRDMLIENGARKTTIVAKTPNLNPHAEGAMWRIFSMVRSMLTDSGMPKEHWGAAAIHAAYILNRTPRKNRPGRPGDHRSPYEMLQDRPPNLSSLKIFGCLAHGMVAKKDRSSKLAEVAVTGFYYGHSRTKRGFRILVPSTGKIIVAHTAKFDEHTMYKDAIKAHGSKPSERDEGSDESSGEEEDQAPTSNDGAAAPDAPNPDDDAPRFGAPSRSLRARSGAIDYDPQAWRFQGHLSTTGVEKQAATAYLISKDLDLDISPEEKGEGDVVAMIAGRKDSKVVTNPDGATTTKIAIPQTYDEAIKGEDAEHWLQAIEAEHEAHIENGTWKLIPVSETKGKKIVGSTWTFDIKRGEDGTLARYKARLCAQGFSQLEGVDFITTYSNTIHHNTLRMILAVAALRGLHLSGADVKTAYLYGFVEEGIKVYMRQPRGYEKYHKGEPMVCQLVRSIYGLRQSGARWEARLVKFLTTKMGFERSQCDPCLYKIQKGNDYLWLCVYVDDLTFASTTKEFRNHVFKTIQEEFNIIDTGNLTWILNTNISQDLEKGNVTVSQKVYIEDTVRTYFPDGVPKVNGRTTPCDPSISDLAPLADGEMIDPRYRSMVGKLVWLVAISRPDMAFAHSMLARHNQGGGERHMKHLMKAFAYLGRTAHYKLTYGRDNFPTMCKMIEAHSDFRTTVLDPETLICFTDSSHGGERPMSGEVLMIGACPIAWKGYRKSLTPLSSCEGEYLAATKAAVEILATQDNGRFLGIDLKPPTIMFNDNKSAVMLADSNTSSKRMKHIATRIAFLREQIAAGTIMLYHIRTEGQLADIFTKALPPSIFHYLRSYLIY